MSKDRLLSDEELRNEVEYCVTMEYKAPQGEPAASRIDRLMRMFNTQKRLYAEQREANVRHDIAALAPPCEHGLDDKDHEHYCGFINNIWQNWASKNGMTWRPDELRAEQRARIKQMTPTEQDKELREKVATIVEYWDFSPLQDEDSRIERLKNEIEQLITADRKRVALEKEEMAFRYAIQTLQDTSKEFALENLQRQLDKNLAQQEEV